MAITPTGIFSLPLKNLQDLIAESVTFQGWIGAVDAAAALLRIHLVGVDISNIVRPFAVVDSGGQFDSNSIGTGGSFSTSGELILIFEAAVSPADAADHGDAKLAFTNKVGLILSEIQTKSGTGGFLSINKIGLKSGPNRSNKNDQDLGLDLYQIAFDVSWGV